MPPTAVTTRKSGQFHARRCYCRPGCTDITIVRADPYVHITTEFLQQARTNPHGPWTFLNDDVLTIRATNRTVIYRILGPAPTYPAGPVVYEAEWPD